MSGSVIVCLVPTKRHAEFFVRFQNAASRRGLKICFLVEGYVAYRYVCAHIHDGHEAVFLTKSFGSQWKGKVPDLSMSVDVLTGRFTLLEAETGYRAVRSYLRREIIEQIHCIFIWNGYGSGDCALMDVARKYDLPAVFFELANVDGRLFVDPQGTNARSLLAQKKEILRRFDYDTEAYAAWKRQYIQSKRDQVSVKQAQTKHFRQAAVDYALGIWGYWGKDGFYRRKWPWNKLCDRLRRGHVLQEDVALPSGRYIFLPLQVSTDTQIMINGNVDLLEALRQALALARERDEYLVIKPHPAERTPAQISSMKEITSTYDKVVYTSRNTFELIEQSDEVVTINSTVGLESKILGHPVRVFGKAFYESFTEDDIARYIMGYLLPIERWSDEPITDAQFEAVLARAVLEQGA